MKLRPRNGKSEELGPEISGKQNFVVIKEKHCLPGSTSTHVQGYNDRELRGKIGKTGGCSK